MDSGSYSRSVRAGAQPGVQWSQQRSGARRSVAQKEPQIPRRSGRHGVQEKSQVCEDQPWFDVDDRPQQQVKCEYIRQPYSASTPKDRGMQTTQVKCELRSPRDRGVDDLLQEARQLCTLFREQELVTH